MHSGGLLRIYRNECLYNSILDVSLDQGSKVRRKDVSEVPRYVRTKDKFLDLKWEALSYDVSLREQ